MVQKIGRGGEGKEEKEEEEEEEKEEDEEEDEEEDKEDEEDEQEEEDEKDEEEEEEEEDEAKRREEGGGGGSLSKISSEEALSKLRLKLNQDKAHPQNTPAGRRIKYQKFTHQYHFLNFWVGLKNDPLTFPRDHKPTTPAVV